MFAAPCAVKILLDHPLQLRDCPENISGPHVYGTNSRGECWHDGLIQYDSATRDDYYYHKDGTYVEWSRQLNAERGAQCGMEYACCNT